MSSGPLYFEIGTGRAHATLSSKTVGSVAVDNAGFNFTKPPLVRFWGGALPSNSTYLGLNQPGGDAPSHPALGHAVLSNGAISSIVVDDPGAGYAIAPYVQIMNSDLDPYGVAIPSNGVGILVQSGDYKEWNGTICPTDPIAVWGATTGQSFTVRWLD
jgi:hypothetical protein